MNITEELQKLAELRQQGNLTEQEFAAAKAKLLAQDEVEPAPPTPHTIAAGSTATAPEQQMWSGRPSNWNYFFSWFFTLLLLAGGGLCLFVYFTSGSNPALLIPVIFGVLLLITIAVRRASMLYVVTNRKVEVRTGLFVKSSNEVRVKDIRSINVTKHGLAGFIGIGSVEFSSAASDRAEVIFVNISGADRVRDLVTNLQES